MNNVCLKCQHCYETSTKGYYRHWCKYFKQWLLPINDEPQRTETCAQLGDENGVS